MKARPFSKLEKDEKTFNHVRAFYRAMSSLSKESIANVDMFLQAEELDDHLKRCGKQNDCEEPTKWIKDNGENLRSYLNTLKILALVMYIDNKREYRTEVVWELFCMYVDIFNLEKEIILDAIRIDK